MCGRFIYTDKEIHEMIMLKKMITEKYGPRHFVSGEIFPTQNFYILGKGKNKTDVFLSHWGFNNAYNKADIINARAESVEKKPLFADFFHKNRVVVPATGFYEWSKTPKQKYLFNLIDEPMFYMAAVAKPAYVNECFTIITQEANDSVSFVHERMPLVLNKSEAESWINDIEFARYMLNNRNKKLVSTLAAR